VVSKITNFVVVRRFRAFADIAAVESWRSAYFFLPYLHRIDPYVASQSIRLLSGGAVTA
jgi:hypothetical protein